VQSPSRPRIQLCGRFVVELDGRRLDHKLPSRQGRLLFAYLALNRERAVSRDELTDALWPHALPAAAPSALTVLLSKLRAVVGPELLSGRSELRLVLPADARVDVEDAFAAVHQAQSAVALADWRRAWGPALRAQFIARRRLLPEHDTPWLDRWRLQLDDVLSRALEAYAVSCLGIGGTELPAAERAGRTLLERSPLRETAYALLMGRARSPRQHRPSDARVRQRALHPARRARHQPRPDDPACARPPARHHDHTPLSGTRSNQRATVRIPIAEMHGIGEDQAGAAARSSTTMPTCSMRWIACA
jgi:DNA-binding SARP family transcriptional activator